MQDDDMKIAGDKPSRDVERNRRTAAEPCLSDEMMISHAKLLGSNIARRFIEDANAFSKSDGENDSEMMLQRRLLLSFTATVGFEQFCGSETACGIAQKSFLDALKSESAQLYKTSADTGAFSFYYLAYRRGGDIERRIGQTFAMLCSHDGDPVYQELGEALYCWFLSAVRKESRALEMI